jgi:hypothetical protein
VLPLIDEEGVTYRGSRKVRRTQAGLAHPSRPLIKERRYALPFIGKRFRKTAAAVAGAAALGLGIFASLGPATGFASSHREAPLVSQDPAVDSTDLYAFVSPDKPDTVTLISNWIPFESPSGGPNFFKFEDGVHYDIKIDNNADAKPDIIYRWTFTSHYRNANTFLYNVGPVSKLTDANLNFFQTYNLDEITASGTKSLLKNAVVAPSNRVLL